MGPEILESEVEEAIDRLKGNKAVGVDGIPSEFWKHLGEENRKKLVDICKEMFRQGKWAEDFYRTIVIPIAKKDGATKCADFRTISLISHASKIMLRILTQRIEGKARDYISETQFGFRKGVGTRDAIGSLRMLLERSLDHNNDVFICFVDFEKAFDRVNWIKMMDILKKIGVDWRDRRLIADLYLNQEMVVRVGNENSEPGQVGRGVRQGCLMSPLLFSLYAESMMMEAMEGINEGIKVGGMLERDVRFADDQAMVASSQEGLQRIMSALDETARAYGMKINIGKTKVMRVSRDGGRAVNVYLDDQKVEQVDNFKYLGSLITDDGRCEKEIKIRIAMAKEAFTRRRELLTKRMKASLKRKIVKTLIWTVLLYGAETWTLRREDIRRLEACEMWFWRRIEGISWKDHMKNEEVLSRVGERRTLIETIVRRKKNWIGHVLRGQGTLKKIIEGRMEGKRGRGRMRIGMLDLLQEEGGYTAMKRRALDRQAWRNWTPRTCQLAEN